MKIAYIAGSYRTKSRLKRLYYIYKAQKVAIEYWKKGYAVICPHLNSGFFDGKASDEIFLEGYLKFVECSDVLIMLPGWLNSAGSQAEHKLATKLRKTIIYHPPVIS
jgi:hypothetical protein